MTTGTSTDLIWHVYSSEHDWAGDRWPIALLARGVQLGWLGPIASGRRGFERDPVAIPSHTPDDIPALAWDLLPDEDWAELWLAGTAPARWSLRLSIHRPIPPDPRPSAANAIELCLPSSLIEGDADESALRAAFSDLHRATTTENAYIHPASRVRAASAGRRLTPTLPALFWMNYLGPTVAMRCSPADDLMNDHVDVSPHHGGLLVSARCSLTELTAKPPSAAEAALKRSSAALRSGWRADASRSA